MDTQYILDKVMDEWATFAPTGRYLHIEDFDFPPTLEDIDNEDYIYYEELRTIRTRFFIEWLAFFQGEVYLFQGSYGDDGWGEIEALTLEQFEYLERLWECEEWICVNCNMLLNGYDWEGEGEPPPNNPRDAWLTGLNRQEFSWSRCDMCNTHLGGERYQAFRITEED